MLDVLSLKNFLSAADCARICDELRRGSGSAATVLGLQGRRVAATVRRATVAQPTGSTVDEIMRRLAAGRESIAAHFALALGAIEAPQFLHYRAGDYFVAHQDGNTPLIRDASLNRKISIVIFLNAPASVDQSGYRGGELVFHGGRDALSLRRPYAPVAGTLLAFRSETTHEVLSVEDGERFTIVSWYLDPLAGPGV